MIFLAFKQMRARLRQTILTFLAVILGAMGYVVFSGLMLGFQDRMLSNLVDGSAHITITPRDEQITLKLFKDIFFPDSAVTWIVPPSGRITNVQIYGLGHWYARLQSDARVSAYAPQLIKQALFVKGQVTRNVNLVGIVPNRQRLVTNLADNIVEGRLEDLNGGGNNVLLGQQLMFKLGLRMGQTIIVVAPNATRHPVRIVGVFSTGSRGGEMGTAYATVETVQSITGSPGQISNIAVRLHDYSIASAVSREWAAGRNAEFVESWQEASQAILTVFFTQDMVRNITTLTIMIVVAFGIYQILNMVVNQKTREIAILRSIGFTQKDIVFLFLFQGLLLGFAGSLIGLALGATVCKALSTIEVPGGQGKLGHMIISFRWQIYALGFFLSSSSCALASFLPARAAGRLSPIEIIRRS